MSRNRVVEPFWHQVELPVVDATLCTACGWCPAVCPTECLAMGPASSLAAAPARLCQLRPVRFDLPGERAAIGGSHVAANATHLLPSPSGRGPGVRVFEVFFKLRPQPLSRREREAC